MKLFLKIVSRVLIVLLIFFIFILVGIFIFLKNFDIKKYKPQIIQAVSQSLGRAVDVKDIDLKVSLEKGIRLHLTDFSIAEHLDFGAGNFVIIPGIDVGVDILQFIKTRQISVPGIFIDSARINIIRDNKGNLNVQTLGPAALPSSLKQAPSKDQSLAPAVVIPAVFIKFIKIENAQIEFIDRFVQPELKLALSQATLDVQWFSLTDPFVISFQAAVLSQEKNVYFHSKAQLDFQNMGIHLTDAELTTDLSFWPLDKIKSAITSLKNVPFPEHLAGKCQVNIRDVVVSAQGLKTLVLDATLDQGEVAFKEIAPGISLEVSRIHADIKNFSLESPFGFDVHLAYLSAEPNIDIKGTAALDLKNQGVTLKDTIVQTDLSTFSMEGLKASIADLKDVSLPERLKGNLSMSVMQAAVGAQGLLVLSADGSLKDWEVKLKELVVPILGVDTNFNLTESRFTAAALEAVLGGGQIKAKIVLDNYLTKQDFDFFAQMEGVDLAKILDQKEASVKVEGLIFGDIKAKGQAADLNSITGDGNFEVKQAKLKDFNVLKTVLDQMAFLPDVSSRLEASLPDKYKEKLKNKDTDINKIKAVCLIQKGTVTIDPIAVEADEFIFSGKSLAGFDQAYALDGQVKITAELSAAMAQVVEELKYFYDENANISLPVHVTGKGASVPVVAVEQMAVDIWKNAIRNEGKKQLENILNKALGTDESSTPPQGQEQGVGDSSQDQESPGAQIINDILNKILK